MVEDFIDGFCNFIVSICFSFFLLGLGSLFFALSLHVFGVLK